MVLSQNEFIGLYDGFEAPQAVMEGKFRNSVTIKRLKIK
jgi:cellobiose phosphorylase